MSTEDDAKHLRIVAGVALAMTPRKLRRDFAEKATGTSDPAQREISEAVAGAVLKHFDVVRKPEPEWPATGREFRPKSEQA